MENIVAIIFGIVQGLTEFVPVSSSGHLLLLHQYLPLAIDELAFDVALHVGTLFAALIYFRSDVARYTWALISSMKVIGVKKQSAWNAFTQDERLSWLLIAAMIPAGVAGLLFEDIIETTLRSPLIAIIMLVLIALVFIVVERWAKQRPSHTMSTMTLKQAIFIGVAQALALIPGTSRSGITIVTGMFTGLTRADSARFSFLVALPLIAGAGLKKGVDLVSVGVQPSDLLALALGAASAAIVGYIAIAGLLRYLSHRSLTAFAVYRIGLAIVMLVVLYR